MNPTTLTPITKFQAIFRGIRSRSLHGRRAKRKEKLVCPFYSSSPKVVNAMIGLSQISTNDHVFDLGSGDGSILIEVAKNTGAKYCCGVEIDAVLCVSARRKSIENDVAHLIDFVVDDILHIDLSFASVIMFFLTPSCCGILSSKLRNECRPGTKIVCYKFPLPADDGWSPDISVETEDVVNIRSTSTSTIYRYTM